LHKRTKRIIYGSEEFADGIKRKYKLESLIKPKATPKRSGGEEDQNAKTEPSPFSLDVISAGKTFSKVISPYKLLARAPIRDRGKTGSEAGIHPGILPNGENGILLVVRQSGKEIVDKMMVTIEEKKSQ